MTATGQKRPSNSRPTEGLPLPRINVEIYPDEVALIRQVKMLAIMKGITFRGAIMEALNEWVKK